MSAVDIGDVRRDDSDIDTDDEDDSQSNVTLTPKTAKAILYENKLLDPEDAVVDKERFSTFRRTLSKIGSMEGYAHELKYWKAIESNIIEKYSKEYLATIVEANYPSDTQFENTNVLDKAVGTLLEKIKGFKEKLISAAKHHEEECAIFKVEPTRVLKTKDVIVGMQNVLGKEKKFDHTLPLSESHKKLDFATLKTAMQNCLNPYLIVEHNKILKDAMSGEMGLKLPDDVASSITQITLPFCTDDTKTYIANTEHFEILNFYAAASNLFTRVAPGFVRTINNSLNTIYNHTESDYYLRPLLSQHNKLIQRLRALGEDVTKEQECKGLWNILRSPTWQLWKAQMHEDAISNPEAIHATALTVISTLVKPAKKQPRAHASRSDQGVAHKKQRSDKNISINDNRHRGQGNNSIQGNNSRIPRPADMPRSKPDFIKMKHDGMFDETWHWCAYHKKAVRHKPENCDLRPDNPHKLGTCKDCLGAHKSPCKISVRHRQAIRARNQNQISKGMRGGQANRAAGARGQASYDSSEDDA